MDISTTRYARVSTQDQDLTSQIHALQAIGYDPIYQEKATGANIERPEWKACNRSLGHGDTLVVVASTPRQIPHRPRGNPRRLASQGRALSSPPREGIDTTTALGKMFFQISSAFAEYERALISEQTKAGLQTARTKRNRMGRPPSLTDEQKATVRRQHKTGESVSAIARILEVSRATIQRTTN